MAVLLKAAGFAAEVCVQSFEVLCSQHARWWRAVLLDS